MPRIDWIEHRLLNWARWRLGRSGGSLGYASVNLADPTPEVREPYAAAPVPTNEIEAGQTDQAIKALEPELHDAVVCWYLRRDGMAGVMRQLGIGERAVHQRIERAHRRLADGFTEREELARQERRRVEALQGAARP